MPVATVAPPSVSGSVTQQFIIEPLNGPQAISRYLSTRFPEEVYYLSPDSHLYRFMSVLLGNSGVNWLKKDYLQARLAIEEAGLSLFDLDAFFGDPFSFGRILDDTLEFDFTGLLDKTTWDLIRSKDQRYRNRALDFVNGARAGNTVLGMTLVARSGLGHNVSIVENYKYLFDNHSDDPLGLEYFGKTRSTEEFIVVPQREVSRNETQRLRIDHDPTVSLATSTFTITYNGETTGDLAYDCTSDTLRVALEALRQIAVGDITVTGGPTGAAPTEASWYWDVNFQGGLSGTDVPEMTVTPAFTDPGAVMTVETVVGGRESKDDPVTISPRQLRDLQEALDRIKPVTAIPTAASGNGLTTRTNWSSVTASSEQIEVIRYATGASGVSWPTLDSTHWIEPSKEHEAPRFDGPQPFYQGWHNIGNIRAYTADGASNAPTDFTLADAHPSQHLGAYTTAQITALPLLRTPPGNVSPQAAVADYAEPLITTDAKEVNGNFTSVINRIYPTDYAALPGVPTIVTSDNYWSSADGLTDDYLEIDLNVVQAVNFLSFDITQKPVMIDIDYDVLDQAPARRWKRVTAIAPYPNVTSATGGPNPWTPIQLDFSDALGNVPFTRFLRIKLHRTSTTYLTDAGTSLPWSIEVKNLRVGRCTCTHMG